MKAKNVIVGLYTSMIALSIFSITVSLAWYSGATKLEIDNLNIAISAEPELSVSFSNEGEGSTGKWVSGNSISTGINSQLIPVSSIYHKEWEAEKSSTPLFYGSYSGVLFKDKSTGELFRPSVKETGYYSEALYLRSNSDVYVTLDPNKTTVTPDSQKNLEAAKTARRDQFNQGLSDEELASRMDDYVNCLRVSFLDPDPDTYNYSIIDPKKGQKETYYGGILDIDRDGYFDTYQSAKGEAPKEILYGDVQNLDKAEYDEPLAEEIDYSGPETCFNAKCAKGTRCLSSTQESLAFTEEDSIGLTEDALQTRFLIPLKAFVPKKVIVSIYAEGWDESSVNDTMGANFDFNLSFKIARER
jgi:hypothetical protein